MFTIEHGFDATRITLIDEPDGSGEALRGDVVIRAGDAGATLEQEDAAGDLLRIALSQHQLRELAAALRLPEGSYRIPARR